MDAALQDAEQPVVDTKIDPNVETSRGEVILKDGKPAPVKQDRAALEQQRKNAEKIIDDAMAKRAKPVADDTDGKVEVETKSEEQTDKSKAEEIVKDNKGVELTDEEYAALDPKVAGQLKKLYAKMQSSKGEAKETLEFAQKVAKKNELLEKELNSVKRGQLQAELTAEKATIDSLTQQAIAAQQSGDYVKGADLLREVAKREAQFEVKNKEVAPVQEGPRQLSPKQVAWLTNCAKERGGVWERTHTSFQQAAADVQAMWNDPKYAEWGIKTIVKYVEGKYTPGKVVSEKSDPDVADKKETAKPAEKFAAAVLGQSPGARQTPTQSNTVQLTDQQKGVARKLFSGMPPAEAYKRYARGMS